MCISWKNKEFDVINARCSHEQNYCCLAVCGMGSVRSLYCRMWNSCVWVFGPSQVILTLSIWWHIMNSFWVTDKKGVWEEQCLWCVNTRTVRRTRHSNWLHQLHLPTQCMYAFHVPLTSNSTYFPNQQWQIGVCNGNATCFFLCYDPIFFFNFIWNFFGLR